MAPLVQQSTDLAGRSDEIHLWIQGSRQGVIKGESQAKAHQDEIDILSFSWGVGSAPVTGGKGKPSLSNVSITKPVDRSSTGLMQASITNELITSAKISWSKSGGASTTDDFFILTLTNAYVTSLQLNSATSGGSKGLGTELVTLSYQKIDISYKQQNAMGLMQAAGSMTYNLPGAQ